VGGGANACTALSASFCKIGKDPDGIEISNARQHAKTTKISAVRLFIFPPKKNGTGSRLASISKCGFWLFRAYEKKSDG